MESDFTVGSIFTFLRVSDSEHLFMCLKTHVYIFFEEISFQIFKLDYYFVGLRLFACGYPVIVTLSRKDCTFPTESSWHSC